MDDLYNNIKTACELKGISVSAMCLRLGMSKSTMSDLKAGRKKSLSSDTILRIANFLDVTSDYLLTGATAQEQKTSTKKVDVTDEDLKFALFHGADGITDEMFEEVKRFAQFVRERENGKK